MRALGRVVLLLSVMGLAGCHCCGTDCEVTKVCCPEIATEKVVHEGWDVECHQICIPPVHCPFSDPCERACGKVIAVKRLKEDKLECGERCLVKYTLIDPCAGPDDTTGESESSQEEANENAAPIPAPAPEAPAEPKDEDKKDADSSEPGVVRIRF